MVLKLEGARDDTVGVTVVIALQVLVAGLAGLLLLEARLDRDGGDRMTPIRRESGESIDFHPELIVRWDDEADYARQRRCTREVAAARHDLRPLQPVPSRSHTHIR